jgi:hypothetical protein
MGLKTFTGGCHCGDVRFEVDADLDPRTQMKLLDCNCSMCTKKGIVHLMVPASQFRLLTSPEAITTYTFNTHVAKHTFCKRCGIHSFYTPRSHPDHVDVNVRCLDGVDPWSLHVERFDGANWEANVATIRDEKGGVA